MNRSLLHIMITLIVSVAVMSSCSETDFDIENGWDNNRTDNTDVDIDTLVGIDASMYHQARIFPGLVDTLTECHIEATLHLDLSKPFTSPQEYGFGNKIIGSQLAKMAPQPIYSTGLYAGAGELVKITIPDENVFGLTVQVGIHTDDLSNVASYFREPIAYTRKTLHSGTNYVRFPLGGYIWIVRDPNAVGTKDLTINFSGVYSAPDFIKDETAPAEWLDKVMNTTVPWMELRSKYLAISIDLQRIKSYISGNPDFVNELNSLLGRWDSFMELFYLSKGISPEADNKSDRMPYFPERVVFDAQLADNLAYHVNNTQAVMMLKTSQFYNEMVAYDNIKSTEILTFFRALNQKYILKSYDAKWSSAINLLPVYRNAEQSIYDGVQNNIASCGISLDEFLLTAYSFAAADSAKIFSDATVGESVIPSDVLRLIALSQLGKYDILKDKAEYSSLNYVFALFRKSGIFSTDDTYMFRVLCDAYQENLSPFFDNWGIELSDANRSYAMKYKLPSHELWKIYPADKNNAFAKVTVFDKASFRYRHNRDNWEAYATDATYTKNNEDIEYDRDEYKRIVANLFDGNKGSCWASYLAKKDNSLGGQPSTLELPYYIVIDLKENQDIDGLYFANGSNKLVSSFIIQTTSATGFALDDTNVQWSTIAELKQTFASPRNEQFIDLSQRINTRYLRIVITELNLNSTVIDTWKEADQEKAKKLNSLRHQQFAEFGTFYYKK